jgi:hypothetical protein
MIPLITLTKKDTDWQWGKKEQDTFEEMKTQIISKPVLAHPQLDKPFELEVDTSGYAVGGVLLQQGTDKLQHTIGFYLATLNAAE